MPAPAAYKIQHTYNRGTRQYQDKQCVDEITTKSNVIKAEIIQQQVSCKQHYKQEQEKI